MRRAPATALLVLLSYAGSRALLLLIGVPFHAEGLAWYWQLLEPRLLRERLWESLFYLHAQPPLFNLLLGVVHHLPVPPVPTLHLLWMLLGACLALSISHALLQVGASPWFSGVSAVALSLSIPWIAYENWLFYDFPCAVLLTTGGACLLRAGRAGGGAWLIGYLAIVAALAAMRSLFHLVWVFPAVALAALAARPPRRRVLVWALVPVLLLLGLYLKNAVTFGFFGASSWAGLSLQKITSDRLAPETRTGMIRSGLLSPFAAVPAYSALEKYEAAAGVRFEDAGVPALSLRTRGGGHPNLNHLAFVEISSTLQRDALTVIATHPAAYVGGVRSAMRRFFDSPVHYPPFRDTLTILEPWWRLHEETFGRPLVAAALFLAAVLLAAAGLHRGMRRGDRGLAAASAWVLLSLGWVFLFSSLVELGENHRFRFYIGPLAWTTLLAGVVLWWRERTDRAEMPS